MSEKRSKHMTELARRSGDVHTDDALVCFLYLLMRDHLPGGVVEQLAMDACKAADAKYTNGWVAKYAIDLADRLRAPGS